MRIIDKEIHIEEIKKMAQETFGEMVKANIDVEKEIMVIGMDLHADGEAFLIENGSSQKNLWGVNLYPEVEGDDWIEFDSMINIKPAQNNRSRGVEDPEVQKKIIEIVNKLVKR